MDSGEVKVKNGVVIDNPKRKTLKIWSNKTNTYYHQSRDVDYYRNFYHTTKQRVECEHCHKMVYTGNMTRHQRTKKCQEQAAKEKPEA